MFFVIIETRAGEYVEDMGGIRLIDVLQIKREWPACNVRTWTDREQYLQEMYGPNGHFPFEQDVQELMSW